MNSIKWYWLLPIIGIFFIEEVATWVFDDINQYDQRKLKFSYIWVYQIIILIIGGTILLAK
jgi:hypothetical protein